MKQEEVSQEDHYDSISNIFTVVYNNRIYA